METPRLVLIQSMPSSAANADPAITACRPRQRRAVHFDPRSAGVSNQASQPKVWSRKYSRPNILVSLVAIFPSAVVFRNPFAFIVPTANEGWQQSALRDFWWQDRFHL
jgi:hypothetical protein